MPTNLKDEARKIKRKAGGPVKHLVHDRTPEHNIEQYKNAFRWIEKHTVDGHGIAVTSKNHRIYPEVTGYYIPTLLRWGHRDLAKAYATHLMSIQKADGSWYDSNDNAPYIFDSGQILKGLVAIFPLLPEAKEHILRGCDWLVSRMSDEGELVTPTKDAWGADRFFCDEHIHLYCLEPLQKVGELFDRNDYLDAVKKIKTYYISHYKDRILHFSLLSHFHAYVMEALVDLGETELARQAMADVATYQKADGSVPGLNNVDWICSTGLFQLAITWFKLGDFNHGDRAFQYAMHLQNPSGGWYGSYSHLKGLSGLASLRGAHYIFGKHAQRYFPRAEISWAVKYFLDALYYRNKCQFDVEDDSYRRMSMSEIDESDGRYQVIRTASENVHGGGDNS